MFLIFVFVLFIGDGGSQGLSRADSLNYICSHLFCFYIFMHLFCIVYIFVNKPNFILSLIETMKVLLCLVLVQVVTGVHIQVVNKDGVYYRYGEFQVGANPGITTTFQINLGSCADNVLPSETLRTSTTWELVNSASSNVSNVVTEYLYYTGQKHLLQGTFVVGSGDKGVLNTCELNVSFCFNHRYEARELFLGQTCPLFATHLHKHAVYNVISASLVGKDEFIPVGLDIENTQDDCTSDNTIKFLDAFSIVLSCTTDTVVDIEGHPLNIEYDVDHQTMTVYYAVSNRDDTTGGVIVVILVLFLSTWLYWTRHIHDLIRFSITNEQTEGNPVVFEKTLRKALQHETVYQSLKSTIYKYQDELYPLVGEKFVPEEVIDKPLAEIAATNRAMIWGTISQFSVMIIDVVVLVGSTTFLASIDKHPNLYHDYTVELVGKAFLDGYLLFWGYVFSVIWPLIIIALVMYASVIEEKFQSETPDRANMIWFTWGLTSFRHLGVGSRLCIYVLSVCVVELVLVAFWFIFANNESYGWVFLVSSPPLLFLAANLNVLRGVISPYYAHLYKYDTVMVLALRFTVEISILTAIHALMPESLDQQSLINFNDGMSVVLGGTMAVITGRDLTWMLHLLLRSDVSRCTLTLLCIFGICVMVILDMHVSVFLLGNIYLDTQALGHKPHEALACSIACVIQLGCIGSIWASNRFQSWKETRSKLQ